MTQRAISDSELDMLLAFVAPPPSPSSDLADRIVARSRLAPRVAASTPPPQRRPRRARRPFVWGAVIAANALAAAAAASSWDGQRFDFRRLVDLPHRVALSFHIRDHHRPHQPLPKIHSHPASQPLVLARSHVLPSAERRGQETLKVRAEPTLAQGANARAQAPHRPQFATLPDRPRTVAMFHGRVVHSHLQTMGVRHGLAIHTHDVARARRPAFARRMIDEPVVTPGVREKEPVWEQAGRRIANAPVEEVRGQDRTLETRAEPEFRKPMVQNPLEGRPETRPLEQRRRWGSSFPRGRRGIVRGPKFRRRF